MARSRSRRRRPVKRRTRRRKESSLSSGSDGSESKSQDRRRRKADLAWICANCGGPHRRKDCPLTSSSSAPPMMGLMPGALGMPPPMGAMGMMGGPMAVPFGMPPAGHNEERRRGRAPKKASAEAKGSEKDKDSGPSRSPSAGGKKAGRRERVEEVEKFIKENSINEVAADKMRELSPHSQRKVIARPLTGDVHNPSKVMMARVRELEVHRERSKGVNPENGWSGAMAQAVKAYIKENDLDASASRQLQALPPYQQALALRFDLSSSKNRSAKFMSLANGLAASFPLPGFGMPPMPGMPFMMPPMGMPPGGMHPGMTSMGVHPAGSAGRAARARSASPSCSASL